MSYSWGAGRSATRLNDRGRPLLEAVPAVPIRVADIRPAPPRDDRASSPADEHQRVADELAPMVEVWQRLLVEHVPDAAGRCRTCTKGGTGLPSMPWPCSIHGIADMARRVHDGDESAAVGPGRLSS
ncbi:hypothetical protein ACFSJD_32305 [Pseudonocardia yunnanensis]|uniref:Uncharacterized protein n=1 Tax=Pseudonocardia yunnanensis TaxID=58107 RepID=A0ABW4F667_9PSEU